MKQENNTCNPDYTKSEHWLSLPKPVNSVDVFYLYPTAWHKVNSTDPNFSAIDNPIMIKGAHEEFERTATVFETIGNIYATFYREADGTYTLSFPEKERLDLLKSIPAKDIISAFDHFINNINNGRPFILAGHSQGSTVMLFLLSDYMVKHPAVYSRMIAAYVIGYPVTSAFMNANKHLKFAEGPDDTGVIISYNTQSQNVATGANIVVGDNIGMVINPINWKRDETVAPASESMGSFMPDSNKQYSKVLNFADARIDLTKGVLICKSVDDKAILELSPHLGLGVYHMFDYPLYFYNLRDNAQNRVKKFMGM